MVLGYRHVGPGIGTDDVTFVIATETLMKKAEVVLGLPEKQQSV